MDIKEKINCVCQENKAQFFCLDQYCSGFNQLYCPRKNCLDIHYHQAVMINPLIKYFLDQNFPKEQQSNNNQINQQQEEDQQADINQNYYQNDDQMFQSQMYQDDNYEGSTNIDDQVSDSQKQISQQEQNYYELADLIEKIDYLLNQENQIVLSSESISNLQLIKGLLVKTQQQFDIIKEFQQEQNYNEIKEFDKKLSMIIFYPQIRSDGQNVFFNDQSYFNSSNYLNSLLIDFSKILTEIQDDHKSKNINKKKNWQDQQQHLILQEQRLLNQFETLQNRYYRNNKRVTQKQNIQYCEKEFQLLVANEKTLHVRLKQEMEVEKIASETNILQQTLLTMQLLNRKDLFSCNLSLHYENEKYNPSIFDLRENGQNLLNNIQQFDFRIFEGLILKTEYSLQLSNLQQEPLTDQFQNVKTLQLEFNQNFLVAEQCILNKVFPKLDTLIIKNLYQESKNGKILKQKQIYLDVFFGFSQLIHLEIELDQQQIKADNFFISSINQILQQNQQTFSHLSLQIEFQDVENGELMNTMIKMFTIIQAMPLKHLNLILRKLKNSNNNPQQFLNMMLEKSYFKESLAYLGLYHSQRLNKQTQHLQQELQTVLSGFKNLRKIYLDIHFHQPEQFIYQLQKQIILSSKYLLESKIIIRDQYRAQNGIENLIENQFKRRKSMILIAPRLKKMFQNINLRIEKMLEIYNTLK